MSEISAGADVALTAVNFVPSDGFNMTTETIQQKGLKEQDSSMISPPVCTENISDMFLSHGSLSETTSSPPEHTAEPTIVSHILAVSPQTGAKK